MNAAMLLGRACGRIGQGLRALFAFAIPVDDAAAQAALSPELFCLFKGMRRSEQHHSLRVMHRLSAAGHDHPDLLVAALLHDCGKARYPLALFERTLVVLVRWVMPRRVEQWGEAEPRGLRRAFVIAAQHPDWSAQDMAAAGASPLAASLARRHQDPYIETPRDEEERLLSLLQWADDLH
jgi:hypothetical protein